MSRFARIYLVVASAFMAAGALFHLAIIVIGAKGYALLGAPEGLVALVGTGSLRPAVNCIVIAFLLFVGSAYGFSGASVARPRLPGCRPVLALIAFVLLACGVLLPIIAAWQPYLLRGLCGRCQAVNGFVLLTSGLCLIVGSGFALGAFRQAPNLSVQPLTSNVRPTIWLIPSCAFRTERLPIITVHAFSEPQ